MSAVSKSPYERDAHERLTAIREGDLDAFLDSVEPWLDSVYEVVITILGSPNAALDATRETFESLWYRHAKLTADELTRDSLLLAAQATGLARLDRVGRPDLATDDKHAVLARAAAVVLGADEVSYLDLYLRHGVGVDALGDALGISGREVPDRFARTRSDRDEVRAAFALWNGGHPDCADLATALDGADEFTATVVGVIGVHRGDCNQCARVHGLVVHPGRQLLAAAPTAAAPNAAASTAAASTAALAPAAAIVGDVDPLGEHAGEKIEQDIEELWASTEEDRRARVTVPVVPARPSRWRPETAVIAVGVAALVVAIVGGVALALLRSGGDEPDTIQSESASEQAPPSTPEEVPPATDRTTDSSAESTSESQSESESGSGSGSGSGSESGAGSASESTTATDSRADSGTDSTTDSESESEAESESVVAGDSGEVEPLPSLDVQLDSCVALGEFGAFVGDPEWVDVWSEVGESEDGLRDWCEETPEPLERLEFHDEWTELQETLDDTDGVPTTGSAS